ncbi:MAG: class II glutamine amidotransferase [Magnetovibrio sp.]|nr:class II glutamine amidotransferase [Magnetovibrio sp.]
MCELLGMSANVPTDICFSFSGLMRRGGHTSHHTDGWGIAFYEGSGCRTFHDPKPSATSEIAKLISNYSIKSKTVISHIRKATHGKVNLVNTHPFVREMWGQNWVFAHNGKLPGIKKRKLEFFHPVGNTDSEHAFCWMLDQIRTRYPKPPRGRKALSQLLQHLTDDLAGGGGIFNMLLSDSHNLYAYNTTKLFVLTRRAPFGEAHLIDDDLAIDFCEETNTTDVVTVIATTPLTNNEAWMALAHNRLYTFQDGVIA